MKKIFVGTWKMILKVFLKRKILGDISVEYLDSISGKNLRGITWEIFLGYFEEDFGGNIDHYILFVDINSQTNILKWNLKFILNLERVWENFKIWIFGMLHNSRGKVVSRGIIRVNESFVLKDVAFISNAHFTLLSVSQLLEDDFKVSIKRGLSRVLDGKRDLVYRISYLDEFCVDISRSFGSSWCLVQDLLKSRSDIRGWVIWALSFWLVCTQLTSSKDFPNWSMRKILFLTLVVMGKWLLLLIPWSQRWWPSNLASWFTWTYLVQLGFALLGEVVCFGDCRWLFSLLFSVLHGGEGWGFFSCSRFDSSIAK
jgi:hypothetical protein